MYRLFFKRFADIFVSTVGIIICFLPMLIIAIIIKCDSKGGALFIQQRVGRNGKPFNCYKFRSMSISAPHEMATKDFRNDSYITRVGHFLRKTSLDELPQLFNIFKGDMSLIGPRPVILSETELTEYRSQTGALSVRPGLTGLAQISGRDNLIDMKKKADIDGLYVQEMSFWNDFKIFFKTVAKVLKQDDIEENQGAEVIDEQTVMITGSAAPQIAATSTETQSSKALLLTDATVSEVKEERVS